MNLNLSNTEVAHATQSFGSDQPAKFRTDIQGLRAIAVLAVILYHLNRNWLPAGFLGVDVFFVVSGFIVTSIIFERGRRGFLGSFYIGRVRRIVPVYLVVLLFCCLAASVLLVPADFIFFQESVESALLFLSNTYFSDFGSYFAPAAYELPLLHTWSLAVEMQFYLILPLLLLGMPKRWLPVTLLFIVVACTVYAEWQLGDADKHRHVYFALMTRVPEFLIGAWLATSALGRNWERGTAGAVGACGGLLLFACFLLVKADHYPGAVAILPCAATALIIAGYKGRVGSWLSKPILVWIGAISYSLYLWHWPVLAFIRYCTAHYDLGSMAILIFATLTLSLSCASYYWIETPLRKPGALRRLGGLVVLALLGIFLIAPSLNEKIQRPLPVELTRYAPADDICHGKLVGECKRGDLEQPVAALVLGDSHAAQLNYFFDAVGKQQKFAVQVITASNCVPIPGFDVERIPDYSRADCLAQSQALVPLLARTDTVIIAGMWQWQAQSDAFLQSLAEFTKTLSAQGKRVIVLAQVPMFEVNVQRMQRFALLGMEIAPARSATWASGNSKIAERLSGIDNVFFVDFSQTPFFQHAPYEDGVLIYQDNHHLNERGARRYGELAAPALAKLIFPLR